MNGIRCRSRWQVCVLLCLSCSQIDPAPQTTTARAGLVNPHVIYVNDDGTFFPSTTEAQEGDHLVFVGQDGGPLRRTDAIVRVTREELDLADDAGIACLTTALPYDF